VARRFGTYLRHDEVGAGMLRLAGAPDAAVEWAAAHHHPERWDALAAVPPEVARALARADGEQVT
jgi:hypothetical protein